MRLLLLTPSLPYPPHQGGAIRNFGIIHGLRDAGHTVDLLSFHDGATDPAATPLADLCARIETMPPPARGTGQRLRDLLTTSEPDLTRRLFSGPFADRLRALLRETHYDLIQFEGLEMGGYWPIVRAEQPTAKLCYDAHNAEAALQRAIFAIDYRIPARWPAATYSFIQAGRIARFEAALCAAVDGVLAVSDEDAAELRALANGKRVDVIPNGIFTGAYERAGSGLDLGANILTFTGKMDYRPNVDATLWFTSAILPRIVEHIPDVKLYIVGQKPHARLDALRDHPSIAITGWVPDVLPFLHATDVYVAPLRMGSGTRFKLLEALAAGCAVVATTWAAAGLEKADARSEERRVGTEC